MRKQHLWLSALLVALVSCSFDKSSSRVSLDASSDLADADPSAPDADPLAPDADMSAPDANRSVVDASTSQNDAEAGVPDAGLSSVLCGGDVCSSDEECCYTDQGTPSCVASGNCGGLGLSCDGPEDCQGGQLCCGGLSGASCAPACDQQFELCGTSNDCSTVGDQCCPFDIGKLSASVCFAQCGGP